MRMMARIDGLIDLLDDLKSYPEQKQELLKEAAEIGRDEMASIIRLSYVMMGGTPNDYIYTSILPGASIKEVQSGDGYWTSAGVMHVDRIKAEFYSRKNRKVNVGDEVIDMDISSYFNAAQIAYWKEFGTSRLKGGGRKVSGLNYSEGEIIQAIKPMAFITHATINGVDMVTQKMGDHIEGGIMQLIGGSK